MKHKTALILILHSLLLGFGSCKDSAWLEAQYDQSLVIPETLDDYQSLLDNDRIMNGAGSDGQVPSLGEASADNYYISNFSSLNVAADRNTYLWATQIYDAGTPVADWNLPYRAIFYCNTVLEGLEKIHPSGPDIKKQQEIKGMALFVRAHLFYQLLQIFAEPYVAGQANSGPGIVLRLTADIGEPLKRSSIQACYQHVITDLMTASDYLPQTQMYKTRPSRAAALALLARVYLTMQNYADALKYADACIKEPIAWLNYQDVSGSPTYPFARFNPEVIYHCMLIRSVPLLISYAIVDSSLVQSYASNDFRKSLFFRASGGGRPGVSFRGSYDGASTLFSGISTAEIYLIRAEAYARTGNTTAAMADLNTLLSHRMADGFARLEVDNPSEALILVLQERRKELLFRGQRWSDLRRLNLEESHATPLTRQVEGITYTLPSNDPRYTFPIPPTVLDLNPDMPQNAR